MAQWLAGGALYVKRADEAQVQELSPRRKGIRRAAKLMFFSGVLVPVFLVISLIIDEGAPLIFPVVVFFISVVMMLYARLFSDKTVPVNNAPAINQAAQTSALRSDSARAPSPAAPNTPLPAAGRQQVRTNELAQPPSVTEHTTRLLDNE